MEENSNKNHKPVILAFFGKSASGKSSIVNCLANEYVNFNKIVSCTTRPKRENEKNKKDYVFMAPRAFNCLLETNSLLEHTKFREWYYGTPKSQISACKINVGVFNIEGIKSLLKHEEYDVVPILVDACDKTRLIRSLCREENPNCNEIVRRFITDSKDFEKSNLDFTYRRYENDFLADTKKLRHFISTILMELEWKHTWHVKCVYVDGEKKTINSARKEGYEHVNEEV